MLEEDLSNYLESLLRLEWPGRRVAVTPAPFPDVIFAEFQTAGILDITVGPLAEDTAWVCFRICARDEVLRRDWLAMARVVLSRARKEFELWPGRSAASGHAP